MRLRARFCCKRWRLWFLRRALLSPSAAHHQRAAEIRGKHRCEKPAAVAKTGRKIFLCIIVSSLLVVGAGRGGCVFPRGLGPAPLLHLGKAKRALSFWPVLCTRTSLLSAACQKENIAGKYLQGRRKAAQIDICAPSPALGWKENRVCKMLGPCRSAKALWRDLSPDSDFYSWHVGKPPLSPPVPSPPPCPKPQTQAISSQSNSASWMGELLAVSASPKQDC